MGRSRLLTADCELRAKLEDMEDEDEDDLGPENEESGSGHGSPLGKWALLHRTAP